MRDVAGVCLVQAQSPPDFSGVYRPVNAFGTAAGRARPADRRRAARGRTARAGAAAAAAHAHRAALGRLARPRAQRAEAHAGIPGEVAGDLQGAHRRRLVSDNTLKCLPPGMPAMMNMAYGMEVMQTKDKITFFSELNDALRRVYLDGRKPTQIVLDDPTYAGFSTGHWEGDTLVVETVALNDKTYIEGFTPHSDRMTIKERIRFAGPGCSRIASRSPIRWR